MGCCPNESDRKGRTPLALACRNSKLSLEYQSVAELLITYGALPQLTLGKIRCPALHVACDYTSENAAATVMDADRFAPCAARTAAAGSDFVVAGKGAFLGACDARGCFACGPIGGPGGERAYPGSVRMEPGLDGRCPAEDLDLDHVLAPGAGGLGRDAPDPSVPAEARSAVKQGAIAVCVAGGKRAANAALETRMALRGFGAPPALIGAAKTSMRVSVAAVAGTARAVLVFADGPLAEALGGNIDDENLDTAAAPRDGRPGSGNGGDAPDGSSNDDIIGRSGSSTFLSDDVGPLGAVRIAVRVARGAGVPVIVSVADDAGEGEGEGEGGGGGGGEGAIGAASPERPWWDFAVRADPAEEVASWVARFFHASEGTIAGLRQARAPMNATALRTCDFPQRCPRSFMDNVDAACDGLAQNRRLGLAASTAKLTASALRKRYLECSPSPANLGDSVEASAAKTPLMKAAEAGHASLVAAMIMSGRADPGIEDALGRQALHHACKRGHRDVVGVLLTLGADPNYLAAEPGAHTPLHYAAAAESRPCIEELLRFGGRASLPSSDGDTVLNCADDEDVKTLISAAIDAERIAAQTEAAGANESDDAPAGSDPASEKFRGRWDDPTLPPWSHDVFILCDTIGENTGADSGSGDEESAVRVAATELERLGLRVIVGGSASDLRKSLAVIAVIGTNAPKGGTDTFRAYLALASSYGRPVIAVSLDESSDIWPPPDADASTDADADADGGARVDPAKDGGVDIHSLAALARSFAPPAAVFLAPLEPIVIEWSAPQPGLLRLANVLTATVAGARRASGQRGVAWPRTSASGTAEAVSPWDTPRVHRMYSADLFESLSGKYGGGGAGGFNTPMAAVRQNTTGPGFGFGDGSASTAVRAAVVEAGADPNVFHPQRGIGAVRAALECGDGVTASWLCRAALARCSLAARDGAGPLVTACANREVDVATVASLVMRGACVNHAHPPPWSSVHGTAANAAAGRLVRPPTPLEIAAGAGNREVCRFLLLAGASGPPPDLHGSLAWCTDAAQGADPTLIAAVDALSCARPRAVTNVVVVAAAGVVRDDFARVCNAVEDAGYSCAPLAWSLAEVDERARPGAYLDGLAQAIALVRGASLAIVCVAGGRFADRPGALGTVDDLAAKLGPGCVDRVIAIDGAGVPMLTLAVPSARGQRAAGGAAQKGPLDKGCVTTAHDAARAAASLVLEAHVCVFDTEDGSPALDKLWSRVASLVPVPARPRAAAVHAAVGLHGGPGPAVTWSSISAIDSVPVRGFAATVSGSGSNAREMVLSSGHVLSGSLAFVPYRDFFSKHTFSDLKSHSDDRHLVRRDSGKRKRRRKRKKNGCRCAIQ